MRRDGKSLPADIYDYDPAKPGPTIDLNTVDPYDRTWMATYEGGWSYAIDSRSFYEQLVDALNDARPDLAKPVRLIPVGHVLNALEARIAQGDLPGFTSIYHFYKDPYHMNQYGSYLVGCTFFSTIYGQSPLGLPSEPYGDLDPLVVRIIQETVWDVVQRTERTGVAP